MSVEYKCKICNARLATHIAVVIYQNYIDYSFSHETLVCDDHDCIRVMSRCLEEGTRDRSIRIYPIRFDSLKYFPIPERKRLESIIIGTVSSGTATQQPVQTQQDKSIAREPSQGNLFYTLEENH